MKKLGLLPKILIAIVLGLLLGGILPAPVIRAFVTFNGIFSGFLGFCIPLIILGLIAPSIADIGNKAKYLLLVTIAIAYSSTILTGFATYISGSIVFPNLIAYSPSSVTGMNAEAGMLSPFFSISIPPAISVITALILAFAIGIGMSTGTSKTMLNFFTEFRSIVERIIAYAIVPVLPVYIMGIFMNMRYSGEAFNVIQLFGKIIIVILCLHILVLLGLYLIAGLITKRNPIKMLTTMLPAYMTALGTASSAATIPVTVVQAKKNGISEDIADFCIPLCATIHMPGSVMKIVATSLAICIMQGLDHGPSLYIGFILMLSVMMIAAPGVPGGAIMVAVATLKTMLGFSDDAAGLMIALYIAIDSFGTACNVTGDGAIAAIIDKISKRKQTA